MSTEGDFELASAVVKIRADQAELNTALDQVHSNIRAKLDAAGNLGGEEGVVGKALFGRHGSEGISHTLEHVLVRGVFGSGARGFMAGGLFGLGAHEAFDVAKESIGDMMHEMSGFGRSAEEAAEQTKGIHHAMQEATAAIRESETAMRALLDKAKETVELNFKSVFENGPKSFKQFVDEALQQAKESLESYGGKKEGALEKTKRQDDKQAAYFDQEIDNRAKATERDKKLIDENRKEREKQREAFSPETPGINQFKEKQLQADLESGNGAAFLAHRTDELAEQYFAQRTNRIPKPEYKSERDEFGHFKGLEDRQRERDYDAAIDAARQRAHDEAAAQALRERDAEARLRRDMQTREQERLNLQGQANDWRVGIGDRTKSAAAQDEEARLMQLEQDAIAANRRQQEEKIKNLKNQREGLQERIDDKEDEKGFAFHGAADMWQAIQGGMREDPLTAEMRRLNQKIADLETALGKNTDAMNKPQQSPNNPAEFQ